MFTVVIGVLGIAIWAYFAPLATTIRATGTLVSEQPTFDLQHGYGGRIKEIHVSQHDTVQKGSPLITLDISATEQTRKNLRHNIRQIQLENSVIKDLLQASQVRTDNSTYAALYSAKFRQNQLNIETADATARTAQHRIKSMQDGINLLNERRNTVQSRLNDLTNLLAKGVIPQSQLQIEQDQLLQIKGEINASEINLISLRDQRDQALIEVQKFAKSFETELRTTLNQNTKQIGNFERQLIRLNDEISQSVVTSPIDGTIVDLNFDTAQMYAPRGQTLLTISEPLSAPEIRLTIPTNAIDQIYVGMTGQLTIPALPQRNMPRIDVQISAVSPEATTDDMGTPVGYTATATIAQNDIENASRNLGVPLRLSSGMPVSVALSGRELTFFDFLIAPFFSAFKQSLQD